MKDVGRGRYRVRAVEERAASELRCGDEAYGRRFVAGYLAILARSYLRLLDRVVCSENFRSVREVISGLKRDFVGLYHLRVLRKLLMNPSDGLLHRAIIKPV